MIKLAGSLLLVAGLWVPGWCEITAVSPEALNDMLSRNPAPAVVDVRSGYDFEKKHILGAVNAPYNAVEKAGLPKDRRFRGRSSVSRVF